MRFVTYVATDETPVSSANAASLGSAPTVKLFLILLALCGAAFDASQLHAEEWSGWAASAMWAGDAAAVADRAAEELRQGAPIPDLTPKEALFAAQAFLQLGRLEEADGLRSALARRSASETLGEPFENEDRLVAGWIDTAEQLNDVTNPSHPTPEQIERAERSLLGLLEECRPHLVDTPQSRAAPAFTGSIPQLLIPEIETGLARCALARGDLDALWQHLERSRAPTVTPVSLAEVQSVLYGSEAALLLYDGGSWNQPIAFWVDAEHAEATLLAERPAMLRAAQAVAEELGSDATGAQLSVATRNFASQFVPARPSSAIHRIYLAPPLGLESFPFEILSWEPRESESGEQEPSLESVSDSLQRTLDWNYPISYIPAGSMLRDRSAPRLWSGNKLVVFTSAALTEPGLPEELRGVSPTRAGESARSALRDEPILHELGSATELRRVEEDEPIVLHLDLLGWHDPLEPMQSGLLCADGTLVRADEIARLQLTTDLVVVGTAVTRGGPQLAWGRGGLADAFLGNARSLVVPRWEVPAEIADRFYEIFYEQVHEALPRDEAFRNARLRLLESGVSPRDAFSFAHWGAGNIPIYVMSRKDTILPLMIGWIAFLIPVVLAIVLIRRRYLRRLASRSRAQTNP